MFYDWFHNQYSNIQLLNILWDICYDRGVEFPAICPTARCSIAREIESMGVEFRG